MSEITSRERKYMNRETKTITSEEIAVQNGYISSVREINKGKALFACVRTFGCQQNEADSERLAGMAEAMGYEICEEESLADLILVNTCAIREHAELKALSITGQFKHLKAAKPSLIIGICGCMVTQEHRLNDIKHKYPYVDFLFGTGEIYRFPELLHRAISEKGRFFIVEETVGTLAEGLPVKRKSDFKAWLSIMYGCNNFCTYCVVPYVRGRERSRKREDILSEARALVAAGYKEITLLGQNVNSYGKDLGYDYDFSDLLSDICKIEGDFIVRFMTSHPKDATEKLFKTMAECEKCTHHLHLPVQCGNDRVLKAMNRGYDSETYLKKVELARQYMPDLVITTDIIVGFPGETTEEFEDTMRLVEKVRYDAMFTFIYSPRVGTKAATMPDPLSREEKQVNFDRLLELANGISLEKHNEYVGKTVEVLVDGESGSEEYPLTSRTVNGRLVHLKGDKSLIGQYVNAKITSSSTWALFGETEE